VWASWWYLLLCPPVGGKVAKKKKKKVVSKKETIKVEELDDRALLLVDGWRVASDSRSYVLSKAGQPKRYYTSVRGIATCLANTSLKEQHQGDIKDLVTAFDIAVDKLSVSIEKAINR
jgi:hypothetical protein